MGAAGDGAGSVGSGAGLRPRFDFVSAPILNSTSVGGSHARNSVAGFEPLDFGAGITLSIPCANSPGLVCSGLALGKMFNSRTTGLANEGALRSPSAMLHCQDSGCGG